MVDGVKPLESERLLDRLEREAKMGRFFEPRICLELVQEVRRLREMLILANADREGLKVQVERLEDQLGEVKTDG